MGQRSEITASSATIDDRYVHIDGLRALAVMLVVVAHSGLGDVVPGGSGVTIFFSISGFIITYLLIRERQRTNGFAIVPFYKRRALKILPPLIVAMLVPSLVYALFVPLDVPVLLSQTFFSYNWIRAFGGGEYFPGSNVLWSLAIEEQFYIVFAAVWLVALRWRRWSALTVGTALVVVAASLTSKMILAADTGNFDRIFYGTDTRIDGIALGVLAAFAFDHWNRGGQAFDGLRRFVSGEFALPVAGAIYLLSLLVRDPWFRDTIRYPLQGIATCIVILFGLLSQSGLTIRLLRAVAGSRPVRLLGLASYSIYLGHAPAIYFVERTLDGVPRAVSVILLCIVGTGVGLVLWRLVEVPLDPVRRRVGRA